MSCANGVAIGSEDVLFLPPGARPIEDGVEEAEGAPGDSDELADEAEGDGLTPVSGEAEGNPNGELPRADQAGDEDPADDDEPDGDDPEQVPDDDLPISNPDPDPVPEPDPDIDQDPVSQPDPVPPVTTPTTPPATDPPDPPPVTNPDPAPTPPVIDDIPLPAAGHCLAGWEGGSCDTCSGQTQSDRLSCRLYIDCYITNDCDPGTCGSIEQVCGVNRIGNGLAPKDIADSVYNCMCGL